MSLDIAFLAVDAVLIGASSGVDVTLDVSNVVNWMAVAVNAFISSKSGVE